jgi:hypothetical protein
MCIFAAMKDKSIVYVIFSSFRPLDWKFQV